MFSLDIDFPLLSAKVDSVFATRINCDSRSLETLSQLARYFARATTAILVKKHCSRFFAHMGIIVCRVVAVL